jgi:hypothetical protein
MDTIYNNIIHPPTFINNFSTVLEFREWVEMGSIDDINATITEFVKYELYEHCCILHAIKLQKNKQGSLLKN